MGRYSPGQSYNHYARQLSYGEYEIGWVVDFYYKGSRQRFPRAIRRVTDQKGAIRFAKKWGVTIRPLGPKVA